MSEERRPLAAVLAEVASAAADPFDIAELMHLATDRACQALSCEAAMILLSTDGSSLDTAGSSTGVAIADQIFDGSIATPCHDAMETGEAILFADDAVPEHYNDFAIVAAQMGVRGALAVPLRHRENTIGTLCLMRTTRRYFPSHTVDDAQRLADVLAASIVREVAHRAALAVTAQLEHALEARVVVEQAKGMVAAELGISVGDASEMLRRFARSSQRRLADVAADVVNRQLATGQLR